jgi:rhomboid protease GluP
LKNITYIWVWITIVINAIIFFIEFSNNSVRDSVYFISIGAYNKRYIHNTCQYISLISCQFIHTGLFHFFINMSSLIFITSKLKKLQSSIKSFWVYIIAIISVSLSLYIFASYNSTYLGNSGAILSLFSSYAVLCVMKKRNKKDLIKEIEILISIIFFSIFIPGVSLIMHLSGLISGGAITVLLQWTNFRKLWHVSFLKNNFFLKKSKRNFTEE